MTGVHSGVLASFVVDKVELLKVGITAACVYVNRATVQCCGISGEI